MTNAWDKPIDTNEYLGEDEPVRYYENMLWRLRKEEKETPFTKLQMRDLIFKICNKVEILEDQMKLLKQEIAELKDASSIE